MTNDQIVTALKAGKWSNKYFCRLNILDHLRECVERDNYLKGTNTPKTDEKYLSLDKEFTDLKIMLDLYLDSMNDLYTARLNKFYEKLEK